MQKDKEQAAQYFEQEKINRLLARDIEMKVFFLSVQPTHFHTCIVWNNPDGSETMTKFSVPILGSGVKPVTEPIESNYFVSLPDLREENE